MLVQDGFLYLIVTCRHKLTVHIRISVTAICIMFWMRAYPLLSIIRASGSGLGPGNREFLDSVKWHRADRQVPLGPKNSRFPGPNPLPLAQVMDMHTSRTLCKGLYKS
jgi:hypothetical protein